MFKKKTSNHQTQGPEGVEANPQQENNFVFLSPFRSIPLL